MARNPRTAPQMLDDPTCSRTPSPVGSSTSTTAGTDSVLRTARMSGSLPAMAELGMCTATLLVDPMGAGDADVRGAVEAAAEAGFTELSVWAFQLPAMGDLGALGVHVTAVEAAMTWAAADATAEAEHLAGLASSLGATKIVAVTMEPTVPDFDQARDNLAVVVEAATSVGAQVCVEFLPWS